MLGLVLLLLLLLWLLRSCVQLCRCFWRIEVYLGALGQIPFLWSCFFLAFLQLSVLLCFYLIIFRSDKIQVQSTITHLIPNMSR